MPEALVIQGGPTVELHGSPAQGTRYTVRFGVVAGTGERAVVKVERVRGALARERAALAWLGASDGPVPRLLSAGAALLGSEPVECLVTERRTGAPPTTTEGWRRMGRAYGRLADLGELPAERLAECSADLPTYDRVAFGAGHGRRIADLGERLTELAASIPDWALLCSARVPGAPSLVVTHGDPGPGNFLDDGGDGSIVDWEEAQIAPRGLDVARLVFIARLGAGPSGYPARDHEERARAVAAGYLEELQEPWQPTRAEWRWWLTAAGVQFIHRRWRLGAPAPWQDAADVLHACLDRNPGR
jgi:aminoglycoside phosphotransferase (APT) family kinase protein